MLVLNAAPLNLFCEKLSRGLHEYADAVCKIIALKTYLMHFSEVHACSAISIHLKVLQVSKLFYISKVKLISYQKFCIGEPG